MEYIALADLTVAVHFAFVLFVALGGLPVIWRPKLSWVHLPAVAWGVAVELTGWMCPLTVVENHLRALGADSGYQGGFIQHYALSWLYPAGLTPHLSHLLAFGLIALNASLYAAAFRRVREHREAPLHA